MDQTEGSIRLQFVASAIGRASMNLSMRKNLPASQKKSSKYFTEEELLKIEMLKNLSHYSDFERGPKISIHQVVYSMSDLNLKHTPCDDADIPERHPSYRTFRVPYDIITRDRCLRNRAKYDEQFHREIQHLIDYQPTAIEASYFVRVMAYTTLWPPLHNHHELDYTSNHLFELTPKEKRRLNFIMTHDFA